MPNDRHNTHDGAKPPQVKPGQKSAPMPDKVPNFPGVPGSTQPTDRGKGSDPKVKDSPQSEGI